MCSFDYQQIGSGHACDLVPALVLSVFDLGRYDQVGEHELTFGDEFFLALLAPEKVPGWL